MTMNRVSTLTQKEVPEITSWKVDAAIRNTKNEREIGNDHINIETLKAGDYTILMTLAKQYTILIRKTNTHVVEKS